MQSMLPPILNRLGQIYQNKAKLLCGATMAQVKRYEHMEIRLRSGGISANLFFMVTVPLEKAGGGPKVSSRRPTRIGTDLLTQANQLLGDFYLYQEQLIN